MSLSTVVDWLDENEQRAYPLTADGLQFFFDGSENAYDLWQLILDASLVCLVNSTTTTPASLTRIITTSSSMVIYVSGQTVFAIPDYKTASYPKYVRNSANSLMVVGDYAATLPINTAFNINASFEPGVMQEIMTSSLGLSSLIIAGGTYVGDVNLREGYQVSLIPETSDIRMEVGKNNGDPLPCGNIRGTPADCSSVISFINGVTPDKSGNTISIVGKNHVNVFDDPANHRIFVGYDFVDADVPAQSLVNPTALI